MTEHVADTISSGGPDDWSPLPRRPRSAAGGRLTALTTAVALVFTGGVVTVAWRAAGSGHAPAELIPSTAFAVGTVDLSMPDGQSDALMTLANRFPHSPTHKGSGSAIDRLLRVVMGTSSDPRVDYDRDIKPWLGDHVALAGWLDSAGKPQMEGLIQSSDDAAARRELDKVFAHDAAVRFADGYAVIANTDALAAKTIAAAHRSSLADVATYGQDISALPGTPFATGWLDGPGVRKAFAAALGPGALNGLGGLSPLGPMGLLGPGLFGAMPGGAASGMALSNSEVAGPASLFAGRVALGVRVTDHYVEVDSRATGQPAGHETDSSLLTGLPAATIGAVELGDPGQFVTGATNAVMSFMRFQSFPMDAPPFPSSGGVVTMSGGATASGSCMIPAPPTAENVPLGVPHRRAILRELRRSMARARAQCKHFHGHFHGVQPAPPRPLPDPRTRIRQATGLQLPDDANTVLGDSLVASYGGLELGGAPKIALRTHPTNLDAAKVVANRLRSHLARTTGFGINVGTVGDDLLLASTSGYAAELEHDNGLGDQAQAHTALGDLPARVTSAGYVDLTRVLPLLGSGVPSDVLHLKAVGFWTGTDGSVAVSQLRVVIG